MRRILVLSLACLGMHYILKDMREVKERNQQLWIESQKDAPDSNRKAHHWNWNSGRWIYEDELKPREHPDKFPSTLDESMVRPTENPTVYVEAGLMPYYRIMLGYLVQYDKELILRDKSAYIYFDENIRRRDGDVGQCYNSDYHFEVRIDPYFWEEYPKYREAIFMHEIGHCILGRGHKSEVQRGKAVSVMHPNWVRYRFIKHYEEYKDHYIKELFK